MPNTADRPRRVTIDSSGPILVEGPVEVVADDGTVTVSERFAVAICTCHRSRTYPWCDTSHRAHKRPPAAERRDRSGGAAGMTRKEADDGDHS